MGGIVSGVTNWVKGMTSLDAERLARGFGQMVSGGTVDLTSKYNKQKKATRAIAAGLGAEKVSSLGKRKALYGTKGGVLGQEVDEVGKDYRGNIFGN